MRTQQYASAPAHQAYTNPQFAPGQQPNQNAPLNQNFPPNQNIPPNQNMPPSSPASANLQQTQSVKAILHAKSIHNTSNVEFGTAQNPRVIQGPPLPTVVNHTTLPPQQPVASYTFAQLPQTSPYEPNQIYAGDNIRGGKNSVTSTTVAYSDHNRQSYLNDPYRNADLLRSPLTSDVYPHATRQHTSSY